jgi:hypothetical protein
MVNIQIRYEIFQEKIEERDIDLKEGGEIQFVQKL